jgi:hypothetical protein
LPARGRQRQWSSVRGRRRYGRRWRPGLDRLLVAGVEDGEVGEVEEAFDAVGAVGRGGDDHDFVRGQPVVAATGLKDDFEQFLALVADAETWPQQAGWAFMVRSCLDTRL